MTTDASLITRVLDGDADAYAELVRRYHTACARFAFRMLGNRQDAEDAVQEAFLRAYRALGRYRERDLFRSWLYRILANQCRSAARRRHRHEGRLDPDADPSSVPMPAEGLDTAFVDDALMRAIGGLDPNMREAFLLKHVEGLEYQEMAVVTGASVSALKMRVKRACDALRPKLEAIYNE